MKETFPTGKQKKKNYTKCLSYIQQKIIFKKKKKKRKENYKICRLGDLQAKGFHFSLLVVLQFTEFYTNYDQADMMQ